MEFSCSWGGAGRVQLVDSEILRSDGLALKSFMEIRAIAKTYETERRA
jgi:hypothetical protein